jgi:hypothetical protein
MSGPIVRKYGFPNFDKIFGKKELEHGVEDPPQEESQKAPPAPDPKPAEPPKPSA